MWAPAKAYQLIVVSVGFALTKFYVLHLRRSSFRGEYNALDILSPMYNVRNTTEAQEQVSNAAELEEYTTHWPPYVLCDRYYINTTNTSL